MKTNRFLLAAGIALALAFTLSCSSDDGGDPPAPGSSIDLSGLEPQPLSLGDGIDVSGEIDVYFKLWSQDGRQEDSILVGKIQSGKLSFDFPKTIDEGRYGKYFYDGIGDALYANSSSLYPDIPDNYCRIRAALKTSDGKTDVYVRFFYFKESVNFTGTKNNIDFELNVSPGLNIIYWSPDLRTTDLSKVGTLEWNLSCEDDY